MNTKHLDVDGAEKQGLIELLTEYGLSPDRATRITSLLWEMSTPEFGEEDE